MPTILVVDDDNALRSLLCMVLEEEGYAIREARSGEDCLRSFRQIKPDLVLLDAVMPDMDGFNCCTQLRSLVEAQHTPILMITFLDDQESIERAFQAGATDYITKPIHWPVLLQRLRRLIAATQAIAQTEHHKTQLKTLRCWHQFNQQVLAATQNIANPAVLLSEIMGYVHDYWQVNKTLFIYPEKNLGLVKLKELSNIAGLATQSYSPILPYYPDSIQILPSVNLTSDSDPQRQLLKELNVQSAIAIPLFERERAIAYLFLCDSYFREWQASDLETIGEFSQLLALILKAV